ncbi:MAG: hypothetical protein NTNFB01_11190 [Nitrospira sp.]
MDVTEVHLAPAQAFNCCAKVRIALRQLLQYGRHVTDEAIAGYEGDEPCRRDTRSQAADG